MKTCAAAAAAVVLLGLLSLGQSAPLSSCDSLVKPITISHDDMLGKWVYIGGSSDLPGSRSLGRLLSSVWLDITATTQSNVLNIIQAQKIYGKCYSHTYNVTFENSTMTIEQPLYLKEVYLKTDCSDCVVAYEDIISGKNTFTSLMLFSRRQSVSPADVEMFKKQAECLQMSSPIMIDTNSELCPEDSSPADLTEGLGRCFSLTSNMTLANSTLSMVEPFVASEVSLNTRCPDCLVLYSKYTFDANTYSGLQLLSRRNSVTAAELVDFKKQVECLNLPAPAVLDSEKGFCPDESASPGTVTTDLTSAMKNISPQVFSMLERITDTEGGLQMLSDIITSSLTETDDY